MRFRLFLLTCLAVLAFVPAAQADTMCVSDNPVGGECDGGGFLTIQDALDEADDNFEADTVKIDPAHGLWQENDLDTGISGFDLTIESSTGAPVSIERQTTLDNKNVFTAQNSVQVVTLKHLIFRINDDTDSNRGIYAAGRLNLDDVSVLIPGDATSATGIQLAGTGNHDFSRVYVAGGLFGIGQSSGTLKMERSLVIGSTNAYSQAPTTGQSSVATIIQSTFYGAGSGNGVAVANFVGTNATLTLRDIVSTNFTVDVARQGTGGSPTHPADLFSDWGAFDPTITNSGPGTAIVSNPMNFEPEFDPIELGEGRPIPLRGGNLMDVDPNGGLRSELGEDDLVDFLGNPRLVNGKRDLGAIEVQPLPVTPPGPQPGPTGVAASITGSLKFTPKKVKRKKQGKVAYSLTAPATVTFTATAKKKGKKKPKAVKLGTQAGKAGANSFTFKTSKLKAGRYTFAATPSGGAPKVASLTIKK